MRCRFRAALALSALLAAAGCSAGGMVPGTPLSVSGASPKDVSVIIEEGHVLQQRALVPAAHTAGSRVSPATR
jgi:hypothetical protein